MQGEGHEQLVGAMSYILTQEEAQKDFLQFSVKDKITVIPFNAYVIANWKTENGKDTGAVLQKIKNQVVKGGTNIYDTSIKALDILKTESDDYNTSIVLMTDGKSNSGNFSSLRQKYQNLNKEIPIYSIMFGEASSEQLEEIAKLTNGKVFDGREDLLEAFKEVRGYN